MTTSSARMMLPRARRPSQSPFLNQTAAAFPRRVRDVLASALTVAKRGAADWRRRSRQRRELCSFRLADIEDIGASELDVWREINRPFWQP